MKDNDKDKLDNEKVENIKEVGVPNVPEMKNNIQFISIIGEVEGHNMAPSDKKGHKI